jgi:hypothetical protein
LAPRVILLGKEVILTIQQPCTLKAEIAQLQLMQERHHILGDVVHITTTLPVVKEVGERLDIAVLVVSVGQMVLREVVLVLAAAVQVVQ